MKKQNFSIEQGPKYETLLLALLAGIVILIYAGTLTTPFIFDDLYNIRENPHIQIPALSLKNLAWAGLKSPIASRPVANISFALNYYFHRYNLVGFHLVNILVHVATGIFLYFLVKATLQTPALRSRYEKQGWIPFLTAFIWMVHPVQTQSVAYLVQRMNSMAAMFYVLSMLLYVKFRLSACDAQAGLAAIPPGRERKWPLLAGCVLAGLMAIGTKEIAATLPAFIILYEWYFFQRLSRKWARRNFLILAGILMFSIGLAMGYLDGNPIGKILAGYQNREFSPTQRQLTEGRVVVFYISLLLWPHPARLNLDHDFSLSYSLTNPPTTLFSGAAIAALIVLAVWIARREPLWSFAILWFFGNLIIESSVIGLELVFEHRNYLPSMFAILAIVSLVLRTVKPLPRFAGLGVVALCGVGILFTAWTYERNKVWADEISLYQDCAEKSPQKARPHNNLGAALSRRGRLQEAIENYQTALRIKPDYADAHYNLGYALARQGHLNEGLAHLSESLRLQPKSLKTLNNIGVVLVLQERYPDAIHYFEEALKLNPTDADVHNNLGYALKSQGKTAAAGDHFPQSTSPRPTLPALGPIPH
jgi:tetratricopeptide (TPR) repeat protein